MGAITTPDGRVIFVPDGIGAQMGPPPVAPNLPGGPQAQQPAFQLDPAILAHLGVTPPAPAPAQPVNPFPVDQPNPFPDTGEAPRAAMGGAAAGARVSGDVAFQKQEKAKAAYNATPEGQIAQSVAGQQEALAEQAAIAGLLGDVASQEAQANATALEDRNIGLQQDRQDIETAERQAAEGRAERLSQFNKAVDAEAAYKVDQGRYWKNKDTGAKIVTGIGLLLGGLGAALQGSKGPSLAMQIVQDAIKQDIEEQHGEREALGKTADRRRNSYDAYRQMTGDDLAAKRLKTAEAYKRTADQMEATASRFADPKAKLNAMQAAAQLHGQAEALKGQAAEGVAARDLQRQAQATARASVGVASFNAREGARQNLAQETIQNRRLLLEASQLDQAGRAAEAKALREQAAKNNELGMPAPPVVKMAAGPDGKPVPVLRDDGTPEIDRSQVLMNQDGTVWNAPDKEARAKLGAKMAAAQEVAAITDEILAIRDDVGGESSAFNSDARQRLDVLQNRIALLMKSGTQGMSSDDDSKKLSGAAGATDVASFRARAAGLEEGRKRTVDQLNTDMRYEGNYTGDRIEIPSTRLKGAADKPEDKDFKAAISKPALSYGEAYGDLIKPALKKYNQDRKSDPAGAAKAYDAAVKDARAKADDYKVVSPQARQVIDNYAAIMTSPTTTPQEKTRARLALTGVVENGQTEAIRTLAGTALTTAGALPAPTEDTGGYTGSATARETVPPLPAKAPKKK